MTTTVTVKTCSWPVAMRITDSYSKHDPRSRQSSNGYAEEFVPAESERVIHITNTRSVSFRELPADAVDLDGEFGSSSVAAAPRAA